MNIEEKLVKQLDQITAEYRRSGSLADAEPEIERILSEAKKAKWAEGMARCLYLQSGIHQSRLEIKKAEDLNLQAKKLAESIGADELIIDCLTAEAKLYLWNNKLKEAYHTTLDTFAKAESIGNSYAMVMCSYLIGSISKRYATDDQALKYFQLALEGAQKFGFLKVEADILDNLSELFLTKLRFADAERYARKSIAIMERIGVPRLVLRPKIRLLTILIESSKVKEAEELIAKIMAHRDDISAVEIGTLTLCKGKIAQKNKKYAQGKKEFEEAIKIYSKIGQDMFVVNAYAILCELLLDQKKSSDALLYAKKAVKLLTSIQNDYLESQVFRLMYEASKLQKNTADALKYLELYNERFKKQEELLLETRLQFLELHAEYQMRQAEITKERQRAKELRVELEFKEQELTEKTRYLIKQTDVIAQFRDDLRAIIRRSSADDPLIRQIKDRLKEVPENARTWEDFNKDFEAAHPAFLIKLTEKHPLLSTMEKKICSLLRVGLTSTDIAKLLRLSDRNIENHRYRIRKKIALNTEKSLHEYLATV